MKNNIISILLALALGGTIIWVTKQGLKFAGTVETARDLVLLLEFFAVGIIATPLVIQEWLNLVRIFRSLLNNEPPGKLERDWHAFVHVFAAVLVSGAIFILLVKFGALLNVT